ncbi:hypothetical protein [Micromonospora sp. NPDC093277]|uniref:hypothetical protein n=1 Tax=Micromonospora sp. NPDC093277 TaxID=3364291 RepID=UPI003811243E
MLLPVGLVTLITLLHRVASRGHGLRLSATGVEFLRRDGVVVRMRWADIREITVLAQRRTGAVAPTAAARAIVAADVAAFAAANTGHGIVGTGEVLTRAQVAQQRQAGPVWQPLGETSSEAFLRLTLIDRDWRAGRIGDWFRVYRPDLAP